jgi:ribosome modulation factor
VSTFPTCIFSSESQLTATSPPFVPKDKEKAGVSDSASVLVTPVCSGYIGALTKPKPSVSKKVEASSSGSSAMAAPMQHANTAPAFLAAWNAALDDNARQALEQVALTHGTSAVRVEALLKRDELSRADMAALQASLNTATAAVNAANRHRPLRLLLQQLLLPLLSQRLLLVMRIRIKIWRFVSGFQW